MLRTAFTAALLVATLIGCGDDDRTPGTTPCDGVTCPAGQMCCAACSGPRFCSDVCPGAACLDAAGQDGGEGASCRSDDDCGGFTFCLAPGAPEPCGIPCNPERICEPDVAPAPDGGAVDGGPSDSGVSDAGAAMSCSGNRFCVEFEGSCCFGGELSSICVPPCDATNCTEGEECGTDGLCAAISCEDSFTCDAFTECVGDSPGADEHGCRRRSCATDGTCGGGGFCVMGACYDTLGICRGPAA